MKNSISKFKSFICDCSGLAATEFVLVFPIMIMMLLGTVELGNGIMANQKTIMASQIVSDLLTRTRDVTDAQLMEAENAGRLALDPFDTADIGFDIISIRFDPDSNDSDTKADPVIVWRETVNMNGYEVEEEALLEKIMPLEKVGEGLVIVYVRFPYRPAFGTRFIGPLNMIETSIARGRRAPIVTRQES